MSGLEGSRWLTLLDEKERRQTSRSGMKWVVIASLATASTAAVLAFVALRIRTSKRQVSLDRDVLRTMLEQLSRQFHPVCRDVAQISQTVRKQIQQQGIPLSEDAFRGQLLRQCQVLVRLEEIQIKVTAEYGCRPEDVRAAQERAAVDDPEVQAYDKGFKMMISDALDGRMPLMPNFRLPEGLSQEKMLDIEARARKIEVQQLLDQADGKSRSVEEMTSILTKAREQGLEEAAQEFPSVLPGGLETFHYALAFFLRDGEFCKEREQREAAHHDRLLKMMRRDGIVPVAKPAES